MGEILVLGHSQFHIAGQDSPLGPNKIWTVEE